MPEPSEKTLRERRFIKSKGLISPNISIYKSKDSWNLHMQHARSGRWGAKRRKARLDAKKAEAAGYQANPPRPRAGGKPGIFGRIGGAVKSAWQRFAGGKKKPARITRTR